jgi:PIN domain nuclease of toxin-antitoxin system
MADYVIDSSSVLAFAFGEPGADIVVRIAGDDGNRLSISSVNLAEVLAKLADNGIPADAAAEILSPLNLDEVPFDHAQAEISAKLRTLTRRAGLSLGDRCCLGLASFRKVAVLTADRKWLDVADDLGIKAIITRPEPTLRH